MFKLAEHTSQAALRYVGKMYKCIVLLNKVTCMPQSYTSDSFPAGTYSVTIVV